MPKKSLFFFLHFVLFILFYTFFILLISKENLLDLFFLLKQRYNVYFRFLFGFFNNFNKLWPSFVIELIDSSVNEIEMIEIVFVVVLSFHSFVRWSVSQEDPFDFVSIQKIFQLQNVTAIIVTRSSQLSSPNDSYLIQI